MKQPVPPKRPRQVIIDQEAVDTMHAFSGIAGVPISVYRRDLSPAKFSTEMLPPYCSFIHRALSRHIRCRSSDRSHLLKVVRSAAPLRYRCHAGLTEMIFPIHCENEVVGYALTGKVRTSDAPPQAFLASCPPRLRTKALISFRTAPLVAPVWFDMFTRIFSALLEGFIAKRLIRVVHSPVVEDMLEHIAEHCTEAVSVHTLSQRFFMSRTTVNRLFRKHVGQCVKDYIVGTRVAAAEMMIQTNPELTLRAIASACGFPDQFTFSKMYKRIRHISPVAYRRKFAC